MLYTSGESSSVPEHTAHRLFSSICFVLGLDLDALDPREVRLLFDDGIEARFEQNIQELERQVVLVSDLWETACLTTPLLESIALKDTLESLKQVPLAYDYRYFAHEIPGDIDYPLCHPIPESVQGIRYVIEYLDRLIVENRFMQSFEIAWCRNLLKTVHPDYRELIINLFEPIATNAIGAALAGGDIHNPDITADMRGRIAERIEGRSKRAAMKMLQEASASVCHALNIEDTETIVYLEELASSLYPRLGPRVPRSVLEGMFLSSQS